MAGTQGGHGSTAAELRLHREKVDERRPSETEGLGANQRVSCVVGEGAELTKAIDEADTRRRPRNERRTTTELHGRARRARESEGVRLRAQLSEGSE